jgi:ribose transport system substrate-binding protein
MSAMLESYTRRHAIVVGAWYLTATALNADASEDRAAGERGVVLFLAKTLGNPFFREMKDGIEAAVRSIPAIRLESRAGNKEDDISGQRQILEAYELHARERRLRGVIVTPASSGPELTGLIKGLNDLAIPIIVLDTAIEASALQRAHATITSFIGSSNVEGGRLAADLVARFRPNGAKILLLNGVSGQSTAFDRRKGFLDRLNELKSQVSYQFVVREFTANWIRSEALAATSSMIAGGFRMDAIFGANDQMAIGAARAVRAATPPLTPAIVGFDAVEEARAAVRTGLLTATIAQNPAQMGRKAIDALQSVWNGQKVAARYLIPVLPVTNDQ